MTMAKRRRYGGFSLIEVLMAVGTLAIGMIFIAGTFLVAIHLTTVSSERTIATVVANEAFAKVKLFGVDLADPKLADDHLWPLEDLVPSPVDPDEFAYPSTPTLPDKQYFWSALCRRYPSDPNHDVQVTVFVSRKVGAATLYEGPGGPIDRPVVMPVPMPVGVSRTVRPDVLTIIDDPATRGIDETTWINDGYTIVEDSTGEKYRVIERAPAGGALNEIKLDAPWDPLKRYPNPAIVWVVPPPIGRGKGPCIAVYQTVIRF